MLLRDMAFGGPAQDQDGHRGQRRRGPHAARRSDSQLEEGSENTKDGTVTLRLPPQSFTVIEAAMTSQ